MHAGHCGIASSCACVSGRYGVPVCRRTTLKSPGSDVPSERATTLQRPGPLLCPHLLRVSQLHHRVQRLTLYILRHLTPEGRRRPWPPPAVPGNLHGDGSPAPSPVGLALEISCSHGTAGSVDHRTTPLQPIKTGFRPPLRVR
jgi:hypothetical protein